MARYSDVFRVLILLTPGFLVDTKLERLLVTVSVASKAVAGVLVTALMTLFFVKAELELWTTRSRDSSRPFSVVSLDYYHSLCENLLT